ncbi:hypothetical protein RJ639_033387 [Escallonia herrerae]|uniref:Uncharacterized protein n=1 Tax=Escallonia herrerae TaxID=1293975 RepID=A0AA89B9G9_9ASTE|nr:hypothetical protein RJ639_033387 [Escallonia herrerae]
MVQPQGSKFHVAMFPWLAMGHMTPFLHLSNELAQRGHKISFLLPKKAKLQLQDNNLHPDLITLHGLAVPHVEGLPLGTETASEIPIFLNGLLATAMDLMRDQVEEYLRDLKPDMVFYDAAHWIPELASHIGFKTVVSAASVAIALFPTRNVPKNRPLTDAELTEPPQGYPSSTVVLRGHEARALSFIALEFGSGISFYERTTTSMKQCDVIAIRTCQEVEGPMCDYIGNQYGKKVLLTGPVLPEPPKVPLEDRWAKWLDSFVHGSVIFCALGSQWVLEKNQFQELILNTRLLAEELKVAVEVERDEDGWFSKESLSKGIKSVMDRDSNVGRLLKKNHAKWKEALARPGYMDDYIDKFIDNLHEL